VQRAIYLVAWGDGEVVLGSHGGYECDVKEKEKVERGTMSWRIVMSDV